MSRTKGARSQHSLDRDKQILQLLAEGKTTEEIAAAVFVCREHVTALLRNLRKEKGVATNEELIEMISKEKQTAL